MSRSFDFVHPPTATKKKDKNNKKDAPVKVSAAAQAIKVQAQAKSVKCQHVLTDEECRYYFIQYPEVLRGCGGNKDNFKCARDHWSKTGCKADYNHKLPETCKYELTDEEAICYIKKNNLHHDGKPLDYKKRGNDLNLARQHWKNHGCLRNLSYECTQDAKIASLKQSLTAAENNLNDLSQEYVSYVDESNEALKNILLLEVTSMPFVFDSVQKQNDLLQTQLTHDTNEKLTQNQSSQYKSEQTNNLQFFNTVLFWVYYVVVLLFAGVMFGTKEGILFWEKVFLIAVFLIYPYVASYVQYAVWFVYEYVRSFFYSMVFRNQFDFNGYIEDTK